MDALLSFIPIDRQLALANYVPLRTRTRGAALFADLSGFTPLTEALVRALGPQRGAEELTRQLNLVYDALIAQVENHHGVVIGFSGDAITCWFDEDIDVPRARRVTPPVMRVGGAGARAIASALAMQVEMQKFAAVPIPNGATVELALKAAVVYGPVRRFAVGNPKIQLIDVLAGATLDRLAETEHHAEKGQVVADEATARALGDTIHIAEWKRDETSEEGDCFAVIAGLNARVEPRPWERPAPGTLRDDELKSWLLPSVYARLISGQATFLAELRPAVSLFMRFGGIDFEGDQEAGTKLDAYVRWVQGIIDKYDGILVQLTIGDKGSYLYAAFGAPVAHDDDTVRALRAARELLATTREFDYITAPQIGIGRGRMRVGPYGGINRRTYGVLGDEVNVAARLMQAAQPGQILVTERVAAVAERSFNFERLEPLRVKGKSEPLRIRAVLGTRAQVARAGEREGVLPLVGRTAERDAIRQAVERATSGRGQVLALLGEAGMGKTRLASEALQHARDAGFEEYRSECPSYGTNSSYLVWHTIWRAFFGLTNDAALDTQLKELHAALDSINPNLVLRAPLLGIALNLSIPENDLTRSLDARVRKQLLEGLLLECVRARALETPLAFALEDCHWLDALSYDLLEMVALETADRPVLVVATLRPPDTERGGAIAAQAPRLTRLANATMINLLDISSEDAARLIELKLQNENGSGEPPGPQVVERLIARAGGNPFYIEELLNYMRDRGLDPRDPHALDALDLPDSLSSLILSRIDRLSESQRATLKVASIIGRHFLFNWLWGAYPPLGETNRVESDLDDMSRLDLTTLEQPAPQRSYIFRHVITHQVTYESQPYATRAELHGHLGHFLEHEFAGDIDRNLDLLAYHFDRGQDLSKRSEYLLKAGEHAQQEYANDAAISYYGRLLPLLNEAEKIPVMLKLGQVYEVVGRWEEEDALLQEGLRLAERLSDSLARARCCAALGTLTRKRGDFAQATGWLTRAQEQFETLGNRPGIGQVLHELGTLSAQQGETNRARTYYQQSLEIRRALGETRLIASTLNNLGIQARLQNDYTLASELYSESLALRRQLKDRFGVAVSLNNLGLLKRYQGEYAQGREMLEESLTLLREIGDRPFLANALTSLAEVLLDQGEAAAARERLVESLAIARALGDKRSIAYLLENFGRAALLQNDGLRDVKLAGAASALRQAIGAPLPEAEQKSLDERLQSVRESFGEDAVNPMWEQGKILTMEEAIAFALES